MGEPRIVPATPEATARAADLLRRGRLVAFPTDTVYGLGADALDDAAVARVFAAKRRPADKPLIVLVASLEEAARHGRLEGAALRLAEAFWPGPLTLILARAPASQLAAGVNPTGATVSLRVPGRALTRDLLRATGRPLTAPSANLSGAPSPRTARDVADQLGDRVDLILDGGDASGGAESTVLDLSGDAPRLVRAGAVGQAAIERHLGPLTL